MTDSTTREMERLVRRTAGPQPWRRLFHAVCGIGLALVVTWLPGRGPALIVLGGVFLTQLAADLARARVPAVNRLFYSVFRHLATPRDAEGLASSTWFTLGVLLAVVFFPLPAAVTGTLVLGLADPVASYVGRRYGARPWWGGSVEGSLVFLVAALVILAFRHSLMVAVPTAVVATVVERRSWPLDDNLALPPATAACLTFLGWLL